MLKFCFMIGMLTQTVRMFGAETTLPTLPDAEGLAGAFAGVSHGALLVAGGANFPGKKPWEGGEKQWHDTIFALSDRKGTWKSAGKLPQPLGYGVAATVEGGVIIAGGADAKQHTANTLLLQWNKDRVDIKPLPALPQPLAYACGAVVESKLYIAGGQSSPDTRPVSTLYCLDFSNAAPRWETLTDIPGGGRMLAAAAAYDNAFWLIGGVDLEPDATGKLQRRYLKTVYRYDSQNGWREMESLPHPLAAAPSPAPVNAEGIIMLGGDDGAQVGCDPRTHRGFRQELLAYQASTARWKVLGKIVSPRVTTSVVEWQGLTVVPSGEIRPGVRTPEILVLELPQGER